VLVRLTPGDHLFKVCPEWRAQREILWAEVWEVAERRNRRFKIRDLLFDGRCSQAVLCRLPLHEKAGPG